MSWRLKRGMDAEAAGVLAKDKTAEEVHLDKNTILDTRLN